MQRIYGEDIDFEAKPIAPLLKLADVLQSSMLSDQTHEVLQDILRTPIFEEPLKSTREICLLKGLAGGTIT